jgi:CRISPR-associated protein Cas5h
MKTLIFDIWGDWAHFKKFFTTASPLTFHIPPITAIRGILGAFLGFSKEKESEDYYLRHLDRLYCGIKIIKPVKTFRMGYNWIETKKAKFFARIPSEKGRYQTVIETLRNPHYRFYIACPEKENLIARLSELVKNHKSIYTPYLGISEHIANFKFVTEAFASQKSATDHIELDSIVSLENISHNDSPEIQFEEGKQYQRDSIPVEMNLERVVTKFKPVIYEVNGRTILAKPKKYWTLDSGENIEFF